MQEEIDFHRQRSVGRKYVCERQRVKIVDSTVIGTRQQNAEKSICTAEALVQESTKHTAV